MSSEILCEVLLAKTQEIFRIVQFRDYDRKTLQRVIRKTLPNF